MKSEFLQKKSSILSSLSSSGVFLLFVLVGVTGADSFDLTGADSFDLTGADSFDFLSTVFVGIIGFF